LRCPKPLPHLEIAFRPGAEGLMRNRFLWFATALLIVTASRAHAQLQNFWIQCTTGSFRACASVQAWNESDPVTGQLYLFVSMTNVQGSQGFTDVVRNGLGTWFLDDLILENYVPDPSPARDLQTRFSSSSGLGLPSGNTSQCLFPSFTCTPSTSFLVGDILDIAPGGSRFKV
jgi:hypothetical protein